MPPALAERLADALVIPKLRDPLAQLRALRQFAQERFRQRALSFEPDSGCGRIKILEAPVRVGDRGSEIRVDDIAGWGGRIAKVRFQRAFLSPLR